LARSTTASLRTACATSALSGRARPAGLTKPTHSIRHRSVFTKRTSNVGVLIYLAICPICGSVRMFTPEVVQAEERD
jgi:hypothetical protein